MTLSFPYWPLAYAAIAISTLVVLVAAYRLAEALGQTALVVAISRMRGKTVAVSIDKKNAYLI